jgi:acyl phosphate:glycerol-3-phosphate acyltransferase
MLVGPPIRSALEVQVALAAACVVAAYFIGGIPWALLIGRWTRGIDIREHGSGNTGAANAFRVLGRGPGFAVFALDYLKGLFAMLLALALTPWAWHDVTLVLTGLAVIVGHTYSPYMRFSGGKGLATAAGVVTILTPIAIVILVPVFFLVAIPTRYISLGAIVAAILYPPVVAYFYAGLWWTLGFSIAAAGIVLWRHRSNIGRIIDRRERKATWGIFPPDERYRNE